MHGATIKKSKYRSLKLSLSLFSYSLNFVYGCVWFYRCNLPSGTVSRIWQVPPGTLHLCWPTNAVFKLVTMYILTIDVFETLVVHTKKNLNHIRESGRSYIINFFFFCHNSPHCASDSSFTRFLYHTQRRTTVGRTLLDE